MTRRLGGNRRSGLAAVVSVSLAAVLAGGSVMIGCGGDNNPAPSPAMDAGGEGGMTTDGGPDGTTPEGSVDSSSPVDTGTTIVDSGVPGDTFVGIWPGATFTPSSSMVASGSNVTIACPMLPTSGIIFYTTDGTIPNHNSKAYSGPVQLVGTPMTPETVWAICTGAGNMDSAPTKAVFTFTAPPPVDSGVCMAPTLTASAVLNNDQSITVNGGGNVVCYTADGTTPGCNAGTCSANSKQYDAATGVMINGTITNPVTGIVSISAVTCGACGTTSSPATQQYTLQAAQPQLSAPNPGTIPWKPTTTPTIATSTNLTGVNAVTIRYTTDGSMPSCIVGTLISGSSGLLGAITQTTNVNAVACKTGYAQSPLLTKTYTVQLNPPDLTKLATPPKTYDRTLAVTAFTDPNAVAAPAASVAGEWLCYTTDSSMPACGATASTCTTAAATSISPTGNAPAISTNGTVLNVIACAPTPAGAGGPYMPSTVATGTYVLQLDPPYLNPPGTDATTFLPKTSYQIPSNMVGSEIPAIKESNPTQVGTPQAYSYACAAKGSAPACGSGACTAGMQYSGATVAMVAGAPLLTSGSVVAGDSWQIIGCPSSVAFLPSAITTVTFSAPGSALAPTVTPASSTQTTTVSPVITNTDTNTVTLCYTTDGSTPTCTTGTCANSGGGTTYPALATTLTGAGAAGTTVVPATLLNPSGGLTLVSGGTGYLTAPGVTFSGGGAPTAQASATTTLKITGVTNLVGGSGYTSPPVVTITDTGSTTLNTATATATLTGGIVTGIKITFAGGGYKSPQIAIAAPPAGGTQATAAPTGSVDSIVPVTVGAGYSSAPTVTIAAPPSGTTATATAVTTNMYMATLTPLGSNTANSVIAVTVCNSSETATPPVTATYTFTEAEPDFTLVTTPASATGNLNTAQTIGGGQQIALTTASNFTGQSLHFNTGTTSAAAATCGSPTYAGPITVPTNATSFSISAIECGMATTTQNTSPVRTVTYTVGTATPVITTDQTVTAGHPLLAGCQAAPCTPQSTWFNTFNATITTATTGATVCYSTSGTAPMCGAGGACASGQSATTTTGPIAVTVSGTQLQAIACSGTLGNSAPLTPMTFTLQVSPVQFPATPACAGTASLGLDGSNNTLELGGPTPNASVCYTTDGSVPGCTNTASVTCVLNGALPAITPALSSTTTVKVQTCLANFSGTSSSQVYTFTPYTHVITPIDGTTTNFAAADAVATSNCSGGACALSTQHGWLTYDANNVYIAVDNVPEAPPNTAGHLPPWYVAVYFGTGGVGGASKDLPLFTGGGNVNRTITAGGNIQYALQWNTANSGAPTWWKWVSGAWAMQATFPGVVGASVANAGNNTADFSVPLNQIGTPTTLYAFAAVLSNTAGAGTATEEFRFPNIVTGNNTNTNYDAFFADVLTSCSNPNAQTTHF